MTTLLLLFIIMPVINKLLFSFAVVKIILKILLRELIKHLLTNLINYL